MDPVKVCAISKTLTSITAIYIFLLIGIITWRRTNSGCQLTAFGVTGNTNPKEPATIVGPAIMAIRQVNDDLHQFPE